MKLQRITKNQNGLLLEKDGFYYHLKVAGTYNKMF